jgi:hypothetical protein
MDEDNVHVGPSDYVPWLKDRKWCHIRMEGTTFGDVPLNLELKLEVWDSPNSAGIVIDAVRCAKLGLDHGLKGALIGPSSYFKKSPPYQFGDDFCHAMTEAFIADPRGTEQKLHALVAERARAKGGATKPSATRRSGGTRGPARSAATPVAVLTNGAGSGGRSARRPAARNGRAPGARKRAPARAR